VRHQNCCVCGNDCATLGLVTALVDPVKRNLGKKGIQDAIRAYETRRPLYVEFGLRLFELLRELMAQEGVTYQAVEQRAKTIDSVREKLARPAKAYRNGLADLTDLCGVRIITYSLEDVSRVCQLIDREFQVVPEHSVDKGALLSPAEFGYRSRHFVVMLKAHRAGLAEWKRFSGLHSEIQVRTVLEHAWAAIDHSLRYKREADVPREQKRALFQLSAILELADDNFDRLKRQQRVLREVAQKRIGTSADTTLELNSVSYAAYADSSLILRKLTQIAYSAGFRPPDEEDNVRDREADTISELMEMAKANGINTIHELNRVLLAEEPFAPSYFAQLVGESSTSWIIGPTFVAILCLIRRYPSTTRDNLLENGFHEKIADRVLRVAANHRHNASI
jgi:putative GTP pyrophosphokinase